MKNELVVKDNILINASYNLEVTEQRLILLSIVRARETGQGITSDSKLRIHAGDYMCAYSVDKHAAYKALKDAANNLFERQFSYKEEHENSGKIGVVKSRWVGRIKYVDDLAILEIIFSPDVVPFITRLEKHFTSYQIKQVSQLKSKYAIRLYEILISWKEIGKTPIISMDDFRYRLGLQNNEYKLMHQLKSRVLDPAINQINEFTDISAEYNQHKLGRAISGFEFKFKIKKIIHDKKTIKKKDRDELFSKLSDKQIEYYSNKLSKQHSLGDLAGNMDYKAFEIWIANILRDKDSVSLKTAKRIFEALHNQTNFKQYKK
jgi:plasmid replication initiation protein